MNESLQTEPPSEARRRAVLISKCSLSDEQVERIVQCAIDNSIEFGSAAVRLGLISSEELENLGAPNRRKQDLETLTPMEKAFRKMSTSRQPQTTRYTVVSHKVRPTGDLTLVHDPYNVRSEKIRVLRTELSLMVGAANQGCVFALLSPHSGEGRSRLAAELAVAFAQLDRKTLLVDADLRQPRQHTLFEGADDRGGLANALSTGNAPDMHEVDGVPNLHLLVAGERPLKPLELLSTDYFKRLISDWRRQYSFVVIDTPPLALFADGLAAVTAAGNALLVSRAQHTDYKGTKEMLRRLAATQSQILGAVLQHF
jgi:capsular exopolysaccharide synthesis family protein